MTRSFNFDVLRGHLPDMPTPFDPQGQLDLASFASLCARQAASGAPSIVVCGAASEAPTLTHDEHRQVI